MSDQMISQMTTDEQILLLELLLRDIRGNWGWENGWDRACLAYKIAKILKWETTRDLIGDWDRRDGRHFRCSFSGSGGYDGMHVMRNIDAKFEPRSDAFKCLAVEALTYPEHSFEDWKEEYLAIPFSNLSESGSEK